MAIELDGTTGISASGNIQSAGNVIATYFVGNGAALTGIVASGGAAITNGSSNVSISGSGANVTVGVAGVGNVAVFSSTDLTISGNLLPAGNVNKNIGDCDITTTLPVPLMPMVTLPLVVVIATLDVPLTMACPLPDPPEMPVRNAPLP